MPVGLTVLTPLGRIGTRRVSLSINPCTPLCDGINDARRSTGAERSFRSVGPFGMHGQGRSPIATLEIAEQSDVNRGAVLTLM
jgi:hypothetical protein